MSILFRCPHCEKQLQAPDNAVGKTAKCQACQGTCKVPAASQSSPQAHKHASATSSATSTAGSTTETIALTCSVCTKRLKAPATSRGKKVRCTCGAVLVVPSSTAETSSQPSSQPTSQSSSSWLDGLPQESQSSYPSNSSPFSFDSAPGYSSHANVPPAANSYYAPPPSSSGDPYGQANTQSGYSAQSSANMYLANAASEVSQDRYVERGETWNVDWAKIGGGALTMVGATVWFVLGLAANRIFFYPPILFIIGLVAVLKGFFDGE